ncbi:MAG TPA: hypothetical protein VFO95_11575 [Gemmatimonadales bacterium]|nr:hypothetical protein [Gemmatimonadales bacterium]
MTGIRQGVPGSTRTCPHCRTKILESASVCPACRHHLRFDSGASARAVPLVSPLKVEGTIRHPALGGPWEYSVMVSIKNERGEEIARHVVGVGALQPSEQRTFSLAVELFAPGGMKP